MKDTIHPQYFPQAKIICACGVTKTLGSTQEELHVEVCSSCHPFYTGKQKLVDTARRVEKYQTRKAKTAEPKQKKMRERKPRVEPLKPVGKLFSTKSKIKSATAKSEDKKSSKQTKDAK